MRRSTSVRSPSRQTEWLKATQEQQETAQRENRRARLQNQLDRWRSERAKDEGVYQDMIREAATNAPSFDRRETYRAMREQVRPGWAERIQGKKAELAALVSRDDRLKREVAIKVRNESWHRPGVDAAEFSGLVRFVPRHGQSCQVGPIPLRVLSSLGSSQTHAARQIRGCYPSRRL
jgi:hypothetical protein